MPEPKDVLCSLEEYLNTVGLGDQPLPGVPVWMAMTGVILIIFVSHLLARTTGQPPPARQYKVINLFRWRFLKRLVRRPGFPLLAQSLSLGLFLLILTAGLFGNEKHNIAPVLTWTWWWALLIFLVLGLGQAFCMICPWEAVSSLVTSWSFTSRLKKLGFERPWPRWGKLIYPAIAMFILLTWFELGNDVTHSPSMTAIMGMVLLGLAVLCAMVFERRAFCRSACLVGRITGLYSLFSPLELRPRSAEICLRCTSKACYQGTEKEVGCPTGLFPGHLKENTYCTLCTACVRSCPHENMALQLRPPGADLMDKTRFQWDEAWLAVVLLALTSFHGFTMTPLWGRLTNFLRAETGWSSVMVFSLLMALMLVAPMVLFWGGAKIAAWLTLPEGDPGNPSGRRKGTAPWAAAWVLWERTRKRWLAGFRGWMLPGPLMTTGAGVADAAWGRRGPIGAGGFSGGMRPSLPREGPGRRGVSAGQIFKAFAYALIPVALFYHLAHNCMHFFLEAGSLIPLLSDPMGWGWDLFGTAGRTYGPLLSLQVIWCLQVLCIVLGHVYGVVVAARVSQRLFSTPKQRVLSLIPLLITMILYSSFSVWLIAQPMEMRTGL